MVEQAAIAGALRPDVVDDPERGPAAAAYIARRLDAIAEEIERGWTGEVRDGGYVFSRDRARRDARSRCSTRR